MKVYHYYWLTTTPGHANDIEMWNGVQARLVHDYGADGSSADLPHILRVPGTIYQEIDSLNISNIYNTKILNKSSDEKILTFKLLEPSEGSIQLAIPEVKIGVHGTYESVLIIKIPKKRLKAKSTDIKIGIFDNNILLETSAFNFIGPTD